ncbi:MAG: hypothetical protein J0L64_15365 [Acidobacteria bacterium]|nr:hypothetical protein [Acidobacteriota bacterium]
MNITSSIALLTSLFCLAAASAQVDFRPPFLGCHIAGEQGQLRVLQGVRGAVAVTPHGQGVVAAACSESRILRHTGRHLILDQEDRRDSFPLEGHFSLALDGDNAVAVNTDAGSVLHLAAGEWRTASFQLPAGIRAIRLDSGRLTVLTPGRIEEWDLAAGALLASDPIHVPAGPAALLSSRAVLAAADGMWFHCTPSSCAALSPAPHTTLPVAPLFLTPLSEGWMAASPSAGLPFAVRVHHGAIESFYLPGESLE